MVTRIQPKVLVKPDETSNIEMDKLLFNEPVMNWELIREEDNLTKQSNDIEWIEWTDTGTFKGQSNEYGIGKSLLMSPFNQFFTWQTTPIIEIVEDRKDRIKFKTEDSIYVLSRIYSEAVGNPV